MPKTALKSVSPTPAAPVASRDFLELYDFTAGQLHELIADAINNKKDKSRIKGKLESATLAEIFDKRSLRTYGSFDSGIKEMGGGATYFEYEKLGIGQKESLEHVAGTLSRLFAGIVIRVSSPDILHGMAQHADVPVFNGMTDDSHPLQWMADMMTFREHRGDIKGKTIVFAGDCNNNVAKTYAEGASIFEYNLILSGPKSVCGKAHELDKYVSVEHDLKKAVKGADAIVTDVWTSMGQAKKKESIFHPYQINAAVMKLSPKALFMHCMPVSNKIVSGKTVYHKEVTGEVLAMPNSVIFDQAENRKHAQNAVLIHCLR